jgi:FkbM family methyltransferase
LLRQLRIIASDAWGLRRVCGAGIALRWLAAIALRFPQCRREGNLQPADAAVGDGPIAVRYGHAKTLFACQRPLTGIREIWVRDEYLEGGYLSITPGSTVVDLGCNKGAFTTLALAHGARVVAVEADPVEILGLEKILALNNWSQRVRIINAFVGGRTRYQNELLATHRCAAVGNITPQELLDLAGGPIDLLKCDIEGSEFELLISAGPLIAASRQIAVELHPQAGDPQKVIQLLNSQGFEVKTFTHGPTVMALCRRPKTNPP